MDTELQSLYAVNGTFVDIIYRSKGKVKTRLNILKNTPFSDLTMHQPEKKHLK